MIAEILFENNFIPDFIIRRKIRSYLKQRLLKERNSDVETFIKDISQGPIAIETQSANIQHYEIPSSFFEHILGPQMKYSCSYFDSPDTLLKGAETRMLCLTSERAEILEGQNILELGCGWGSLSLWIAKHYPHVNLTSISNSSSQKNYIDVQAKRLGLKNINVITTDINTFHIEHKFDRVISVEMFEHMRNIPALFNKISNFLVPDGKLFVHIFSHIKHPYLYEISDKTDWMAKYFFTGGMMPHDALYSNFNENLSIEKEWTINGTHYKQTAEAWLANMDLAKNNLTPILTSIYGKKNQLKWWVYWRTFFMACSELFGYNQGDEWHVKHYLFSKNKKN